MRYYNGVVFRGYLPGVAESVLAGGQYDQLMQRMGRRSRGVGFALHLDRLEELDREEREWDVDMLLLYDEKTPVALVTAEARRFAERGVRVSVQRAIPAKLRFREILDLREGERP